MTVAHILAIVIYRYKIRLTKTIIHMRILAILMCIKITNEKINHPGKDLVDQNLACILE